MYHHHRLLALVSGLLALTIIFPVRAQTWRGSEAIGVQAGDSKGKPIVGARVVLSFQARGSEGNPPEVATDQKGRAVVAGLAAGAWQVEVQHPDFLSYVAVFDLQRGKKPSINASFLEAGGRSLTPMRVKLSKGNPRDASPPLPVQEARSQTPPQLEPDRATVEQTPTPPTEVPTPAPKATVIDEPSRQDEAKPEPAPSSEAQVAEKPLKTPPAETTPAIEESALPEEEETRVPEPTPMPVPDQEPEPLPMPQQVSPSTTEPPAPVAQETESDPEPTLEATSIPQEPESQPDTPAEPEATEEAPSEIESNLVAETVDEVPEIQAPPPGEPESIAPEPLEEEPVVGLSQVTEAPLEQRPEAVPSEPADQPVVPTMVTEEAASQEPQAEATPQVVEQLEMPMPSAPEPPSAPAPVAPTSMPADRPMISSYRDGSCSECRTGEWAVQVNQAVAGGRVACPVEANQAARDSSDSLGNSVQLELSGFIGPAADGSNIEALAAAEPDISQAYRQQLASYLGGTSNCQLVSVVLPKSVRFAGFRYEAFDGSGGGECAPDRGCLLAGARWLASPVVQRGFSATVVWGIFENTAEGEPRFASLTVYFRPPSSSWQPPTQ